MFLNFCAREEWLDERVTQHFEMPKKGKKVMPVFTSEHYKRLLRFSSAPGAYGIGGRGKETLAPSRQ